MARSTSGTVTSGGPFDVDVLRFVKKEQCIRVSRAPGVPLSDCHAAVTQSRHPPKTLHIEADVNHHRAMLRAAIHSS